MKPTDIPNAMHAAANAPKPQRPLRFASRMDAWLIALLALALLATLPCLALLFAPATAWPVRLLLALVLLPGLALLLWVPLATDYQVQAGELLIRSGPFRWRVPVQHISRITPSRSLQSAPALSLKRLRIEHGRFGQVLISPRDQRGLMQALLALNPAIDAGALHGLMAPGAARAQPAPGASSAAGPA